MMVTILFMVIWIHSMSDHKSRINLISNTSSDRVRVYIIQWQQHITVAAAYKPASMLFRIIRVGLNRSDLFLIYIMYTRWHTHCFVLFFISSFASFILFFLFLFLWFFLIFLTVSFLCWFLSNLK